MLFGILFIYCLLFVIMVGSLFFEIGNNRWFLLIVKVDINIWSIYKNINNKVKID